MAARHAQQDGNVNLYHNTFLVDTEIPAGGSALDKRLAPVSDAEGLYYGQPRATPEGRAMASKAPPRGARRPLELGEASAGA